ncbi:MAG TPA: hypothetical protein VGL00_02105 [Terracidiphilus sp.]
MPVRTRLLLLFLAAAVAGIRVDAAPPSHDQFHVAVYIPVFVVQKMKDPAYLENSWKELSSQVAVDKVYIETYRSGTTADDALLETVKKFFVDRGVQVAGGIAYVGAGDTAGSDAEDESEGQFVSMCYTDPKQRAYVQQIAELTARHFDEIMLDDFYFNNTKRDSDIAAKANLSWTDFRLKLMDDVSRELVLKPARAANPKVKVIIKFPNWYEHFQANGYDLDKEPKMFDGIYTGTETRDPVITDQHLQEYESYMIVRYFDRVAQDSQRSVNGGGWVDIYANRYLDRYAEQLWDTMLAKTPQMMLFQYSDLLRPVELGERSAWSSLKTSFTTEELAKWHADSGSSAPASYATAAGYALNQVNAILGKLGKPLGIAAYKPYQSTGEDFLHNCLGMIGIPVELYPTFPSDPKTVLLTEEANFDPDLVSKIRAHLEKGGNVVITSGLLKKLQDKGIGQIADLHATGNVLRVNEYWGASGAGAGAGLGKTGDVLVPEIAFQTNDAWPVVRGTANGRGAPLLLMNRYSKGILFVLTIPENANDLYALPQPTLTAIRQYIMSGFPVWLDAPARVSLFAYDNNSFVVQSYLDAPAQVTVSTAGPAGHLRNLATGEQISGTPADGHAHRAHPSQRNEFKIEIPPHSFVAFSTQN